MSVPVEVMLWAVAVLVVAVVTGVLLVVAIGVARSLRVRSVSDAARVASARYVTNSSAAEAFVEGAKWAGRRR